MLVSSKIATKYFTVRTNIELLSKNAFLLTLLFMFLFFLGALFTIIVVLLWERFSKIKGSG